MKILQAVVTSVAETLEGGKGTGLVRCSENLPNAIKQEARQFGYPTDAKGQQIYSLKIHETEGCRWILMNRTVPSVDYTGRTDYVSHTIAIREEELKGFLRSLGSVVPSAFEFMGNFDWLSSWQGELEWLKDNEDLDETKVPAFSVKQTDRAEPLDFRSLLAFDYTGDSNPEPKRAVWQLKNKSPDEMLEFFHQTWLCLDPWQGMRAYREHLGEPVISIIASWQCSVITNLGNCHSGDYQWVVASPECPSIPNRDLIDPLSWNSETPESIKMKIDSPLRELLVERCVQGPENWAQANLKSLLDILKRDYAGKVQCQAAEIKNQIENYVAEFKGIVVSEKEKVSQHESSSWWAFDKEEIIIEKRESINALESLAKENSLDLLGKYDEKANAIFSLLDKRHDVGENKLETGPLCFPDLISEFDKLANEYRESRKIVRACEYGMSYLHSVESLTKSEAALKIANRDLDTELKSAKNVNANLSLQLTLAGKGKSPSGNSRTPKSGKSGSPLWLIILLCVCLFAVTVLVIWGLIGPKNDDGSKGATKITDESEERVSELRRENDDLNNKNKRLEGDVNDLNKKVKDLEKVATFSTAPSGQKPAQTPPNPIVPAAPPETEPADVVPATPPVPETSPTKPARQPE